MCTCESGWRPTTRSRRRRWSGARWHRRSWTTRSGRYMRRARPRGTRQGRLRRGEPDNGERLSDRDTVVDTQHDHTCAVRGPGRGCRVWAAVPEGGEPQFRRAEPVDGHRGRGGTAAAVGGTAGGGGDQAEHQRGVNLETSAQFLTLVAALSVAAKFVAEWLF